MPSGGASTGHDSAIAALPQPRFPNAMRRRDSSGHGRGLLTALEAGLNASYGERCSAATRNSGIPHWPPIASATKFHARSSQSLSLGPVEFSAVDSGARRRWLRRWTTQGGRTHCLYGMRGSQVARLYSLQRNPRERCGAKMAIESARDTRRRRDNSVEVRCRRRRRVCHAGPTGLWHRSEGRLEKRSRPRAGEVVSGPAGENWSGCIFLPFLFSFSCFQIPN
jgi:hypothetical protein